MTKDEFLDIMGGIDGGLIESVLDIPRMETVEMTRSRPNIFGYIACAAACAAAVLATALFVNYFNGIMPQPADGSENSFSSENSSENSVNSKPDFIRGWDPEDVSPDGELALGGSMTVSSIELDGIRVSLILHEITKLPGEEYFENNYDYTDYYGAKDIVLYVVDDKGRKVLEENITPHGNDNMRFIHKNCLTPDSTRLFRTESGSEDNFVLMQFADYNEENDAPIARFYEVNTDVVLTDEQFDENGISSRSLFSYKISGFGRIGGWGYGFQASRDFYYDGGTTFVDPEYRYKIIISPNSDRAHVVDIDENTSDGGFDPNKYTGWDPEDLEYDAYPDAGKSAVVSKAVIDGMQAELIMINVVKRPGERHYIYSSDEYLDMWVADGIFIYIKDDQGRRVLSHLPTPWTNGIVMLLPGDCLFDGCTRLFAIEQDEKINYVIMQYFDIDEDSGMPIAVFISGDMETYASAPRKDENGISEGVAWLSVSRSCGMTNLGMGYLVSTDLVYNADEGGIYDRVYGNMIKFDFD